MTLAFRVASLTMMVALLLGGPLAPLASAQQQPPPQPDVFKETMKADEPKPEHADVTFNDGFYDVTAGVMTAFLVPGRVITCGLAGGLGIVVLVVTLGSGYRAASGMLNEGCGGKWIVRGQDLVPDRVPVVGPSAEKK